MIGEKLFRCLISILVIGTFSTDFWLLIRCCSDNRALAMQTAWENLLLSSADAFNDAGRLVASIDTSCKIFPLLDRVRFRLLAITLNLVDLSLNTADKFRWRVRVNDQPPIHCCLY